MKGNKYGAKTKQEYMLAYNKEYYARNREKYKQTNKKYRDENKEYLFIKNKLWKEENKQRHCELNRLAHSRRKVRLKNRYYKIPKDFDKELLMKQNGLCIYCKTDITLKYHLDHIMPVALGGDNHPENLQLLCPNCNMCKNAKHPDQWLKEIRQ